MTAAAEPSSADPCGTCPWRTTNQGKPHPDGWYTAANRRRLWAGLRNGNGMTCHPTDPDNVVSPAAQAAGYKPAPEGAEFLECRGAVILQQREMQLLMHVHDGDQAAYRRARPPGLTRAGVAYMARRLLFPGVPMIGGPAMGRPNLDAPVSHPRLPWTPEPDPTEGQP